MIIKQAAQQLPPVNMKLLLKLGMRQASRVRPIKEADQRLKLPAADGEWIPARRLARQAPLPATAAASLSACAEGRTSPPEG